MFNSGNSTPFSMPVAPIGNMGNCGGMGGWGNDWIALAILALIFGDGWGMGGMGGMGMFLPFMMMGGGFGGFNGFGGNGGALTRSDMCDEFNAQNTLNGIRGLEQGLCNGFYNVSSELANGFHGVDNAICNLGYTMQQGFNQATIANLQGQNALQSQIAQCCCDNRVGQMQIANQMAADTCAITNQANTNTRDIIESNNAGFRAILDKMCQQELAAKDATIAAQNQRIFGLELSASQANQNNVLMAAMDANKAEILRKTGAECPTAAYIVQPPQPVTFPTNCCGTVNYAGYGNNGCGCAGGGCC